MIKCPCGNSPVTTAHDIKPSETYCHVGETIVSPEYECELKKKSREFEEVDMAFRHTPTQQKHMNTYIVNRFATDSQKSQTTFNPQPPTVWLVNSEYFVMNIKGIVHPKFKFLYYFFPLLGENRH